MISDRFNLTVWQGIYLEWFIILGPLIVMLVRESKWLKIATQDNKEERDRLSRLAYGRRFLFVLTMYIADKSNIASLTKIVDLSYYVPMMVVWLIVWMYGSKYKKLALTRGFAKTN